METMFEPAYIPEWMLEIKKREDREEAESLAKSSRLASAELKVRHGSPLFWKNLCKELTLATTALPQIYLRGTAFVVTNSDAESSIRLIVRRDTILPGMSVMTLFYRVGGSSIRCVPEEGDATFLKFCVGEEDVVGVLPSDKFISTLLDPEGAAQFLLLPMIEQAKRST